MAHQKHLDHFPDIAAGLLEQLQLFPEKPNCRGRGQGVSGLRSGFIVRLRAQQHNTNIPTSAVELVSLRFNAVKVVLLVSNGNLQLLDLALIVVPQPMPRGLQGAVHAHTDRRSANQSQSRRG